MQKMEHDARQSARGDDLTGMLAFPDSLSYADAMKRFAYASDHGMDRRIWHVLHWDPQKVPHFNRCLFQRLLNIRPEFRLENESSEEYVTRLVKIGERYERAGHLYVVKNNIGFDFRIHDMNTSYKRERLTLEAKRRDEDTQALEAIVELRVHSFRLGYKGWSDARNMPDKERCRLLEKPNQIIFSPYE